MKRQRNARLREQVQQVQQVQQRLRSSEQKCAAQGMQLEGILQESEGFDSKVLELELALRLHRSAYLHETASFDSVGILSNFFHATSTLAKGGSASQCPTVQAAANGNML